MPTPKGTVPWNAGKSKGWIDARGYRVVCVTTNGKRRQIKEHRKIMEDHEGRKLEPWEVVHHKDGDTLNNDLANLEIKEFGQHTAEHNLGSRKSYESRRTMEAFGHMRAELTRLREINTDLYEALEAMVDRWEPSCIGTDRVMWENSRAALAKARGETTSGERHDV